MVEVVDSIIADLEVRYQQYVDGFDKASAAHGRFGKSADALKNQSFDLAAEGQKYKAGADTIASAEEQSSARVTRARKARATSVAESAKQEVTAEQAAATKVKRLREQAAQDEDRLSQQTLTARRRARLQSLQDERNIAAATPAAPSPPVNIVDPYRAPARSGTYEEQLARTEAARTAAAEAAARQASSARTGVSGATDAKEQVAAEGEVNATLVEQIRLRAGLLAATKAEKVEIREQLADIRDYNALLRAGLSEEAAAIELDSIRVVRAKALTEQAEKQVVAQRAGVSPAFRFAEGAGLGRSGGSAAAIGGIVAAGTIAGVAELAKKGLEYALSLKQDSEQLGLTTRDLQIYRTAAQQAGATTEQFKEAFGQLADNLGKAQEGTKAQALIFSRLRIDIGNAKDGYKTLSDVLPTLSDRLSQIADKTQRQAIEQALGGEQLRKLDPILSQGAAAFDRYAQSIEKAGGVLSNSEIQRSAETAKKIQLLNDQLQRNLASTVANNATAIERLASAFFTLADGALKAFNYLRLVDNLDVINGGLSSRVRDTLTGADPQQDRRRALKETLETPDGRTALLAQNSAALKALDDAGKQGTASPNGTSPIGFFSDQKLPGYNETISTDPKQRYAQYQRVLSDRATILRVQRAADAANNSKQTPVQPGKPDGNVLAGPDKKGPKGKSAADLDAEEVERTKRFNDELAGLQEQAIRAQESMTGSIEAQAAAEKELADRQLAKRIADIQSDLAKSIDQINKSYPKGGGAPFIAEARERAKTLEAQARLTAATDQQARDQETAAAKARVETQHAQTQLSITSDLLSDQLALARTIKDRRDIELKLLANAKEQERVGLEGQLKTLKPGDPARQDVQAKLANLDTDYASKATAINRKDAGPLQAYADSLPKTAQEIKEQFEQAAVSGVESLNNSLDKTIGKMLHLHGLSGQILGDFIKIALQAAESKLIGSIFGGISGAPSTGDFGAITGLAGGGSFVVGGNGGIDRNLLSINGRPTVRVNNGETIAVIPPNVAASNARVSPSLTNMTLQQNISIDGRNSVTPSDFAEQIIRVSADHANRVAAQAGAQAVSASPARVQRKTTLGS